MQTFCSFVKGCVIISKSYNREDKFSKDKFFSKEILLLEIIFNIFETFL